MEEAEPIGANHESGSTKDTEKGSAPMGAPEAAPMNAPMKSLYAPNAPDTSRIDPMNSEKLCIPKVMQMSGALGAISNHTELDTEELDACGADGWSA
jgi:hypothetical protein